MPLRYSCFLRTIGRHALTASKEIAVSAWYVQMLIKYSIQLWIFLLRSPDFGIVAGLAVFVLLCASLPYMSIGRGVIAAVAFHEVHSTPHAQTGTQCHNQSLQNIHCTIKEFHSNLLCFEKATLHTPEIRLQKAENHGEGWFSGVPVGSMGKK